ncbi:uncharacterized protein LOC116178217 [Photinus pyralis]|uniref:uncharacterized protein LOC116178217 n=1 Tax=Photinus pyralis TaxID=7054 RepID=UPI0012672C96|nr:uncharacterized protein LOC116178217 [Photinus pyralis]
MKTFTVLVCIVAAVAASRDKSGHSFNEQCEKVSGVDPALLADAFSNGKFPDDSKLKAYFKCVLIGYGILNEAGEVNGALMKKTCEMFLSEDDCSFAETCAKEKGSSLDDTALLIVSCVMKGKN